jgi:hypothetical protein
MNWCSFCIDDNVIFCVDVCAAQYTNSSSCSSTGAGAAFGCSNWCNASQYCWNVNNTARNNSYIVMDSFGTCQVNRYYYSAVSDPSDVNVTASNLTQLRGAGVVDGTVYNSSNSVLASWNISSDNFDNKGVFLTFTNFQIETYGFQQCYDYIAIYIPSNGTTIRLCGLMNSTYLADSGFRVLTNTPASPNIFLPVGYMYGRHIFFFNESYVTITFASDLYVPSYFKMFYYSDNCTSKYSSNETCVPSNSDGCVNWCSRHSYCWGFTRYLYLRHYVSESCTIPRI